MAKQPVGPVVRHLEKAILAVCGGALLYFVAMFGVMSPNQAGGPGEEVGPAEIGGQIRNEAERLRDNLLRASAPTMDETEKVTIPNLAALTDPVALAGVDRTVPSPVQPAPAVPPLEGEIERKSIELVDVIQTGRPGVLVGRSGVYLAPAGEFKARPDPRTDESTLADVNWGTVWAPFDRAEQEALYAAADYGNVSRAVFLGADLQRRMMMPNGTWTDWEMVPTISLTADPPYPQPQVYPTGTGNYNVSEQDRQAVRGFIELIVDGENNAAQLELMRPLFPAIKYGDPWLFPKPAEYNVLVMDAEYQREDRCRYPECAPAEATRQDQDFDELMEEAQTAFDEDRLEIAMQRAQAAKDKAESDRDRQEADKLLANIQRAMAEAARRAAERLPVQILWAHDAGFNSLRSGRTYQYRMRARLYNRLCGIPTLLADPKQAEIVEMVGPWSEPSEVVAIRPDTVIFLRSARANRQEVKVEVFKWDAGEWFQRSFTVGVGQRIGEPKSVSLTDGERRTVDFDTGAVVVDIDFRRTATVPSRRGARLETVDTAALVYIDPSGQLHEHLMDVDKASDQYGRLKDLVKD